MTREEYEAKIDEKLKAVKQELMAEYKEEEPSIDGWKGDTYYFVDNAGIIVKDMFHIVKDKFYIGDNTVSMYRVTHGNAFRTYEEAEFKRERDVVLYELSKFAEPKDREWNGKIKHYYIYWNWERDIVDINCNNIYRHTDIYFAAEEDAKKAIEAVGEQRIAKFYLGVDLNE